MAGSYYVPLPAYNPGPGINFEPINSALDGIIQQNNRSALMNFEQQKFQAENTRADKQLAIQQQSADDTHKSQVADLTHKLATYAGGYAQDILDDPNPQSQLSRAQKYIAAHPDMAASMQKNGIDPNDPIGAMKAIVAETRGYQNPMDVEQKRLDLEKARIDIDAGRQKNSLNDSITRILNGDASSAAAYKATGGDARGTAQPVPTGPGVQPQSYYGLPQNPALQPTVYGSNSGTSASALAGGTQSNVREPFNAFAADPAGGSMQPGNYFATSRDEPGPTRARAGMPPANALASGPINPALQLVSSDSGAQLAPPSAAAPAQAQPDLVDTPLGKMTKLRAQRLGLGLSLAGKGDAGKLLVDAASANALDKAAANQNDKDELAATGQIATLDQIKKSFNAKYLNIPQRIAYWGKALQDKFGTISEDDKKELTGYTQFRQTSWHNLNRILKDLSGTAVTENEMKRQLLDQPNPGQGVGDGDSPTEFAAKLQGQLAFAHSAIARARFLRSKGFTGKPWESGISVDDMPAIIKERGDELYQQMQQANPKADARQLQQSVQKNLKQEFGI